MRQRTEAKSYVSNTDAESIQIVTVGSGFDAYHPSAKTLGLSNSVAAGLNRKRTMYKRGQTAVQRSKNEQMMKMHNRMQQAKLLSQQEHEARRPKSNYVKNTPGHGSALSKLLSYVSPMDQT